MALNFGAAFGGLAQGLAEGLQTGVGIAQRQEQIDLHRAQVKISAFKMVDDLEKWSPTTLKTVGPAFFKQLQKVVGEDVLTQGHIDAYMKGDPKQQAAVREIILAAIKGNEIPDDKLDAATKDMSTSNLAAFGKQLSTITNAGLRGNRIGVIGINPDTGQPIYGKVYERPSQEVKPTPGAAPTGRKPTVAEAPTEEAPDTIGGVARAVGEINRGFNSSGKAELLTRLKMDKEYQDAIAARDTGKAYERLRFHATEVTRDPNFLAGPQLAQSEGLTKLEGDKTKAGDDYLKTLPPGFAAAVKATANYETAPPKSGGRYNTLFMGAVKRFNPDYDEKNWAQYKKALNDFSASGEAGRNIRSLATAQGHLGTMVEMFQALKNGDIPAANAITNFVRRQLGKEEVTNADAARVALSDELKRVFTVVGVGSEADRKLWFETLNTAKSPEQARGVLTTISKLLDSRVAALEKQWKDTGPPNKAIPGYPSEDAVKGREMIRTFQEEGKKKAEPTGPTPSQGAIDYLRKNPSLAPQFDEKYGPGSAQRYLGQ